MSKITGVPRTLFWDTNPDNLDLQENKRFIIERALELGDDRAIKWLFSTYQREEIKRIMTESGRISRKSSHYWSLVLKE